jgi:hypothetical protein
MAPIIILIMVDLHFTKRAESIRGSIVHKMGVPSIREACVERREHCSSVLVRCIVGRKVRVGQGVAGGRKF